MIGVTADDVAACLLCVGSMLNVVWFCNKLHWLAEVVDLGVGGVSHVELVFLFDFSRQ